MLNDLEGDSDGAKGANAIHRSVGGFRGRVRHRLERGRTRTGINGGYVLERAEH